MGSYGPNGLDYFGVAPAIDRKPEGPENKPRGIEAIIGAAVTDLDAMLGGLRSEMADRRKLSLRLLESIQYQYRLVKAKLYCLDHFPVGNSRAIEQRRATLEAMLDTLTAEGRREQIQRWQDIAKLNAESRVWRKQRDDQLRRARILRK